MVFKMILFKFSLKIRKVEYFISFVEIFVNSYALWRQVMNSAGAEPKLRAFEYSFAKTIFAEPYSKAQSFGSAPAEYITNRL